MSSNTPISRQKGVGLGEDPQQWNLLREDINLPAAVLLSDYVEHNLRWMQKFINKYQMKLAPHGKTTMAPKLFHRQLEHGAWAITLATAHQVQVAYAAGVRRIIMANQLVGKTNMTIIRQLLDEDPDFDFYCLIDSSRNVEQLAQVFPTEHGRPIQVLLEIGVDQGRTGIRNERDEQMIVDALDKCPKAVQLVGVELFEGVLTEEKPIRAMLQRAIACFERLHQTNRFARSPAILSGAGSSWYDVVAEEFSRLTCPVDIVLRSGCYLSHDTGIYHKAQQRILEHNTIAKEISDEGALQPALQIWAYVQSTPEPTLAIITMGKRDAAFDAGYPVPILHYRTEWAKPKRIDSADFRITKMMDQHAFLACPAEHDIHVGDMIGFDISHPCLTFDKWRKILLVDSNYTVLDIIDTYF